jgi:hypothetical protein
MKRPKSPTLRDIQNRVNMIFTHIPKEGQHLTTCTRPSCVYPRCRCSNTLKP